MDEEGPLATTTPGIVGWISAAQSTLFPAQKGTAVLAPTSLEIDLNAIAANWRQLDAMHPGETGAAVKADAYGLGAEQVAPALLKAGCQNFFVAHLAEGLSLRPLLTGAMLAVLHGILPGEAGEFVAHDLLPVLTSLGDVERWRTEAKRQGKKLPAILHADTGMSRLGMSPREIAAIETDPALLDGIEIRILLSHLINAEIPEAESNLAQLQRFNALRPKFPAAKTSLANSSGMFLDLSFQAGLARPGAALYGINPTPHAPNPMRPVIRLNARILQIRTIEPGETVGYNATWTAPRRSRIATVDAGYADGYPRSLSNIATARFDGHPVPLVGRVSMDLATFDVTDHPAAQPGDSLELIGPDHDADAVAAEAGTNGYEILTSLGRRYQRRYLGAANTL
jgi:alanine racemase